MLKVFWCHFDIINQLLPRISAHLWEPNIKWVPWALTRANTVFAFLYPANKNRLRNHLNNENLETLFLLTVLKLETKNLWVWTGNQTCWRKIVIYSNILIWFFFHKKRWCCLLYFNDFCCFAGSIIRVCNKISALPFSRWLIR